MSETAFQLKGDGGLARYIGAAPPQGHSKHHYYSVVHTLDVETMRIGKDSSPAYFDFNLFFHSLARAIIVSWYEVE